MSLKTGFLSILSLAVAVAAFSAVSFGQDAKPAPAAPEKVQRPMNPDGRPMGPRKFGRSGMGPQRGGPGMKRRGMAMMFRGLHLTDAQKTQIQGILASNKPAKQNNEELRTLRMTQRQGLLTTAQQERLTAIRTQRQTKGSSVRDQILGVLTPEQKAIIDQRKLQMQQRQQRPRKPAPPAAPKPPNS